MKTAAIIVAGGSGTRMKSAVPKQFLQLAAKPVLMHTIENFAHYSSDIEIIVVLPTEHIGFWKELCEKHSFNIKHTIVEGGETRFRSVLNGLKTIDNTQLVAIHDGVRPLVSHATIDRCIKAATVHNSAVPTIAISDSIRKLHAEGSTALDRTQYCLVQTPQVFNFEMLCKAYKQAYNEKFTDDASVWESADFKITLVEGNNENIKITTAFDMLIAENIISSKIT